MSLTLDYCAFVRSENCKRVVEQLEKVVGAKEGAAPDEPREHAPTKGPADKTSLNSKYRKFYMEQVRGLNSRRVRSSFAAASLLASVKLSGDDAGGRGSLVALATEVLDKAEELRSATDCQVLLTQPEAQVRLCSRAECL
jgi:hypothetical protein